jgi:hypothetical protein
MFNSLSGYGSILVDDIQVIVDQHVTFRLYIHNQFLCPNILDVVAQRFVSGPIYVELDGMGK